MRKQLLKLLLLSFGLLSSGSAWADDTYQRITSTGDLEVGKDYIIVHEDANVAMGVVNSNVGSKVSVTITSNTISLPSTSDVNILTLGGSSSEYTLYGKKDSKYVGYGGSNYMVSAASVVDNKYKWTIAFSGDNAVITNYGDTDRLIKAQNYYKYFIMGTTTNGLDIQLYKKVEATLSSIAITTAPTKISYTEDEVFDKTGMVVTATYNDASTADITSLCTFTPSLTTPLLPSNTSIEVSYTENAVTKTANQAITVAAKPRYTITWMVNGAENKSDEYKEGVSLASEFPTLTTLFGKTFMGWLTTSSVASDYSGSFVNTESATATANITYYAVFATFVPGDEVTTNDNLTAAKIGVNTYEAWSNLQCTSNAKYAGYSTENESHSIQMNATSPSGIISTISGGKLGKVTVVWDDQTLSHRILQVYGKNSAYTGSADLYNDSKKGTLLGTIVKGTNTELIIDGDYTYIGLRSSDNAIYLSSISITWINGDTPDTYSNYCTTITVTTPAVTSVGWATYVTEYDMEFADNEAYVVTAAGENVTLQSVTKVRAGVPVLLKGVGAKTATALNEAPAAIANKLAVSTGGAVTGYVLSKKNEVVGFYKWLGGTLDAGKVYLPASEVASAREFIGFDEATGIKEARGKKQEKRSKWYDLQGRSVGQPTKGVYIVNGKKVVIAK